MARKLAGPSKRRTKAPIRSYNILPYELRGEVIKQIVWQDLPSYKLGTYHDNRFSQYSADMRKLERVCNPEILDHFDATYKSRLTREELKLARYDKLLEKVCRILNYSIGRHTSLGRWRQSHQSNAELCFCNQCIVLTYPKRILKERLRPLCPIGRRNLVRSGIVHTFGPPETTT